MAGIVGPLRVGYGSVVGAGGVLRKDVPAGRLVVSDGKAVDLALPLKTPRAAIIDKGRRNIEYISHLIALREWYRVVRLRRLAAKRSHRHAVLEAAVATIQLAIDERGARLAAFLEDHGFPVPLFDLTLPACPVAPAPSDVDHVTWVQALEAADAARLQGWLQAIVDAVSATPWAVA